MKVGGVCGDLPNIGLVYADKDVLGFDVSVNDLTLGVQVVKSFQNLKKKEK